MINGKQCTILWHVNDFKISHIDANVVTGVIRQLEETFGNEAPLTVTRRKVHEYFGMTLDFSVPGKTKIYMVEYIDTMLKDMPTEFNGEAATPAANHLFMVIENGTKLEEDKAVMFHHNVAKLLFLCKHSNDSGIPVYKGKIP